VSETLILTKRWTQNDPSLAGYRADGGYKNLEKAIGMAPAAIVDEVKASNLRGRGGAGFPTGLKWTFLPKDVRPRYLCINADESEPGTFKDRYICEYDPHLLIEGMVIGGYAIGAVRGYIYLRYEYPTALAVLEKAIEQAYQKGYLGKNILGKGVDFDLSVHRGAGAYICGEETALMDSLEGGRGNPRLKPPFPAQYGVYGKPTTVNNVETLCNVPLIVERGVDWFKSIGPDERNTGPKLYCLSGHVKNPGVFELPMTTTAEELIFEHGGGMLRHGRKLKAFVPGGSSVPVLTADECVDLRMDFDSVAKRGSMLGSAAAYAMDDATDMVLVAERTAHFYAHESCGQCTPCREGTGWIEKIIARIRRGEGSEADLATIESAAGNMMNGTTICPLADAAAMPALSFVRKFRDEFLHYIRHGRSAVASL
jgi:NADH-quinone oxidoreductase subunit F